MSVRPARVKCAATLTLGGAASRARKQGVATALRLPRAALRGDLEPAANYYSKAAEQNITAAIVDLCATGTQPRRKL